MFLKKYIYQDLSPEEIRKICQDRYMGVLSNTLLETEKVNTVKSILEEVKQRGDEVLLKYAQQWDRSDLNTILLDQKDISEMALSLNEKEKEAIELAYHNIKKFHQAEISNFNTVETMPGVTCWKESRPIDKVGLYIPGGSAPLISTLLMLAIPARLAGVREIVLCTPAQKEGLIKNLLIHPAMAYIAQKLQIDRLFLIGGAAAIGAMAYGTASIPKVDKILGPGNSYVTLAKQLICVNTLTSIDMPAGPSEVLVIGDNSSNPAFVASDLLAQAEHGPDSQVVLVSPSSQWIDQVNVALADQINTLPRNEIVKKALGRSFSMLVKDVHLAIEFSNLYAPEHLILSIENFKPYIHAINTAGSVFLGSYAPESAGDYASGTNHTLPTSGFAKMYSGVSVASFQKMISFQSITKKGLAQISNAIQTLANMEGLEAHAKAVAIRLD